jgi:hypothetical protein
MARLSIMQLCGMCSAFISGLALAQEDLRIRASEAGAHVGEYAEVCGVIADTNYARRSRGSPTYLNFDKPYPESEFTAIVWGKDRKHFAVKPETLLNHKACVYGKIETYKGKPQIILVRPEQIASTPPESGPEG